MITLKDLAQKLEVSISTVSKALNDSSEISQTTIDRVKALAKYYNYQPNKVALSLKNSRTKTIGVIIPSILNPFFARVLYGIEKEANLKGYQIITCMSNESLEKERSSMQLLANGSVDGFILAVSEETQLSNEISHLKQFSDKKIPIVMFDRVTKEISCDKIMIDDFNAAYEATKFLINKGRKHIALISTISKLNVGQSRVKGYYEAINETSNKNSKLVLTIEKEEDAHKSIRDFLKIIKR